MSQSQLKGRLIARVERFLGGLAARSFRHPGLTLGIAALIGAVAAVGMSRLKLDTDLGSLLPESFESVRALEALQDRFGSIGYVVVCGMDAEPEQLERFARDVAERVEKVEGIRYVDVTRPVDFFQDRALYFADLEDLQTAYDRLKAREKYEKRKNNPMYIDLEDAPPPPLDFSDLEAKYKDREDQRWLTEQIGEPYYLDRHKRMIIVLARPASRSSDVQYAYEIVSKVEASIADLDTKSYGKDFYWATTGRYRKKYDQKVAVQKDLGVATSLAVVLVLFYLGFHFRRLSAILLIMAPLGAGMVWTLGATGFIHGQLNILTGFIGAILLGIGIDHGIHLLSRYDVERSGGAEPVDAVDTAFGNTGRAVVVAALTTLVAFAGVGISEFRAFREFGVIAAVGVALVMLAYWSVLPALLAYAERFLTQRRRMSEKISPYIASLPRHALFTTIISVLCIAGAVSQAPDIKFNFDFEALQDSDLPTFRLDLEVNRILGYAQNPIIALTPDVNKEQEVVDALRERKREYGEESRVDFIASVADLVPEQQEEKHALLLKIRRMVKRIKPEDLENDEQRDMRELGLRMMATPPFTRQDLPLEVKRQFLPVKGQGNEGFVLIFPSIQLHNGIEVSKLAEEVRGIELKDAPRPIFAGESMILTDILDMVSREAIPVLTMTLVLVALTLWIFLGSLTGAIFCFVAAAASLMSTIGLAAIGGVELNYMNIVMIPVLFGLSVDGAVHVVGRGGEEDAMKVVFSEVGRAISGSVLTTMLGFGVLNIADHPGLNSLGTLAVLGMAVNLLVALVALPAFLTVLAQRRKKKAAAAGA